MAPQAKRVLLLLPSLTGGGAERVFLTLVRHLDRSRFEPHLAVLQAQGAYVEDVPKDIAFHDLKASRIRYALPGIVRVAWKVRPHTILSTLGHLNLALIACRHLLPSSTRLLVREAAIASAVLVQEARHPQLWKWLYRRLYRRADRVVCMSDSMVNDMMEHFNVPRNKLVRIYNPVDVERVQRLAGVVENPYIGPGPQLVAAGRLTRQKGFDVLLDSMPAVLDRLPNARLTILGEGPLRHALTQQAQRLGMPEAVRLLGFQQNPWPFLKHANLFVLPSRYEGMPNILLEALAVGAPVVASDCPGAIQEIQGCDGGMVLVPPEDPRALAEAIISVCKMPSDQRECLEDRRATLGKFDLPRIVGEYSKLLLS